MNVKIKLKTGRSIHLQGLVVLNTYRGFLEGDPDWINRRILWQFENKPDKLLVGISDWKNIPRLCINSDSFLEWSKSGFPKIQCCGEFVSYQPSRDESKMGSALVLVWFQNEICPTVSPENQSLMENVDWVKHAMDFDW